MSASILLISIFDHYPVELSIIGECMLEETSFKFQKMWWQDPNLLVLLEWWWKETKVGGSISFILVKKLKVIKQKLKEWNRVHFQNIFVEKANVEAELEALNEEVIKNGMTNEDYARENALKEKLVELLKREEIYWKDKSQEVWLSEGNANSNFFHASVIAKRAANKIEEI